MQTKEIVDRFITAQNSLVIQQSDFSLAAIYDMVIKDAIDVSPHYQRRDRWPIEKQSALIESFLLNVPVPPVFLSEDEYGRYSVIDGKQRITAICDFLRGDLRLKGLDRFIELENSTFHDLPSPLQNALYVRPYIRVTTLLQQSDPTLKYEVFLRLNTGGDSLKAQEIRNVAYSGPLNDMLVALSDQPFLKDRLKITSDKSAAYRNMDDVEHVLRFFMLRERWESVGNSLSQAMDEFMARNRDAEPNALSHQFLRSLSACEEIWGRRAFQKPNDNGWRDQMISPLYDAQMVSTALLNDTQLAELKARSSAVVQATSLLFKENTAFAKAVNQGTNTPSAVRLRISVMHDTLCNIARG
ncbi:DUF262 domain-containing protein [Burkholderia vietnamiensis]|uniref:DUF262 domain-containing protein n=1 Tax=Burkholderia vietnamiensis TaxID=60552 RepID=UPI001CF455FD|nr:DUF262 domain-containing protein [Burkholderia vietnamiensis]MCA8451376.1 DUF262 domain-containing protein [Burkholderia vietnamiensis]HDR8951121.1 DUF262 domain-containing protein [Burkholderia vietnamiensis]